MEEGHHLILPDRSFVLIYKDVKKHDTLFSDKDYIKIFQRHGFVIHLREESPYLIGNLQYLETVKKSAYKHFKMHPCNDS